MHSKNEKIILKIEDITPEGSGVGRAEDGYVLFVPGTAPGDTAECTVLKAGRSYGY
ncbi:MAG: TRAM domain-containing protein, partial [Clostridia bacterium]|nr:TRAM domain-containing protein [Clostridia bacterium]